MDSLQEFLDHQKEIMEKLEDAEEDEIVITNCGRYYDTIKKHSMSFSFDTHTSVIGLISNF